jgi:aspartate aminotransferase-like enzyme
MYPIQELGELAHRYGLLYIVDAVSSMAGANVETDRWGIDLAVTASQKCFSVPAGLAMVSISGRAWETMELRKKPAVSFSLDLLKWKKMWIAKENGGQELFGYRRQPFSMPVYLVYALQEAVNMIMEEGLENRFRRHVVAAEATRAGLTAIGLELYVHRSLVSPTVSAIKNPAGIADAKVRQIMETRYGIAITGGLEQQAGKAMRIGHMGMTAAAQYILPTIMALENALTEVGYRFEHGNGVDAARQVFARGQ